MTNTTLYIGVTADLVKRVYEHKQKFVDGFSNRYNTSKLVYYEVYNDPYTAITREKQLKGLSRYKKDRLINNFNPEWKDLYQDII